MNTIDKIIELIKNDKKIGEDVFFLSDFRENVTRWTDTQEKNNYDNIKWLFLTYQKQNNLVGVNIVDQTIWTIDTNGKLSKACDTLQEFPYEMLRIECAVTKTETVEEYFEKYQHEQYQETLERYEKWCKDNEIQIDKNNNYHNEYGVLFKKSFVKE